ncbi:hypothetical protein HU200_015525 [Digitaria exilis]|uniref:BPM/SPOP BACK domain-containing protein n=1 Tax=Digitaria exilis TaxID=1010633 RepID=A0A835KJR8_9POAL|nr:hypothetical protein HU200_015525 [Digitaria exilis]
MQRLAGIRKGRLDTPWRRHHRTVLKNYPDGFDEQRISGYSLHRGLGVNALRVHGGEHVDMHPDVFRALLHFIYTDTMPAVDMGEFDGDDGKEMTRHLLRLKVMCEAILCESIDVDNVATLLALADQHHCKALGNACAVLIAASSNRMGNVVASQGYVRLKRACPDVLAILPIPASRYRTNSHAPASSLPFLLLFPIVLSSHDRLDCAAVVDACPPPTSLTSRYWAVSSPVRRPSCSPDFVDVGNCSLRLAAPHVQSLQVHGFGLELGHHQLLLPEGRCAAGRLVACNRAPSPPAASGEEWVPLTPGMLAGLNSLAGTLPPVRNRPVKPAAG